MEDGRRGYVAMWLCESVAMWPCGYWGCPAPYLVLWLCGYVAMWLCGYRVLGLRGYDAYVANCFYYAILLHRDEIFVHLKSLTNGHILELRAPTWLSSYFN